MYNETCNELGHKPKAKSSPDFKKIKVHFVFDVKHDRRLKETLEADGNIINNLLVSAYLGLVRLKN